MATATTLLITVTACGSNATEESYTAADEADTAADDLAQSHEPIVHVEESTDLVDPEGSVLGTAWIREADSDGVAELEVQVAGMTQGFHGIHLYEVSSCQAVGPESVSRVLPPMLVLENGIGSITTLIGPVSMGDLLDDDGVTVVINPAVEEAPEALAASDSGSHVACGAFAQ